MSSLNIPQDMKIPSWWRWFTIIKFEISLLSLTITTHLFQKPLHGHFMYSITIMNPSDTHRGMSTMKCVMYQWKARTCKTCKSHPKAVALGFCPFVILVEFAQQQSITVNKSQCTLFDFCTKSWILRIRFQLHSGSQFDHTLILFQCCHYCLQA